MEFVVLRPRKATESRTQGPRAFGISAPVMSIRATRDVTSAKVAKAEQESEYGFFAMPVGLIAPVKLSTDDAERRDKLFQDEKKAGSTWGIRALGADKSEWTGRGVKVAILDTGIDLEHPAFADPKLNIKCRNFVDDDNPGDVQDTEGHGTHTAATVFGREVEGIRIGVAPGITEVMIGKVLGPNANTATVLRGIQWACDENADVILMSLGFDIVGLREEFARYGIDGQEMTPEEATWRALSEMVRNVRVFDSLSDYIGNRGDSPPLVIAACGNSSLREEDPATIIGTAFPAAAKGFFAVSAVRKPDRKQKRFAVASFANSGAQFAGPGQDVLSAAMSGLSDGNRLMYLDGTSMAAPHVAGIAALWAERLKKDGNRALQDRISVKLKEKCLPVATTTQSSRVDFDVLYGMPRAPQLGE